jgi:hypothetical protein
MQHEIYTSILKDIQAHEKAIVLYRKPPAIFSWPYCRRGSGFGSLGILSESGRAVMVAKLDFCLFVLKNNLRFSVSHFPGALNVFCDLHLGLLGQLFFLLLGKHSLFILEHQGKSKKE